MPLPTTGAGVDTWKVDERLRAWRPTKEEVDEIVRSLRPLLRELAFREQEKIAAEVLRRRRRAALGCGSGESDAHGHELVIGQPLR